MRTARESPASRLEALYPQSSSTPGFPALRRRSWLPLGDSLSSLANTARDFASGPSTALRATASLTLSLRRFQIEANHWCTGEDSNLRTSLGGTDLQSVGFNHSPTCAKPSGECGRSRFVRQTAFENSQALLATTCGHNAAQITLQFRKTNFANQGN